jgi:tetratricopeptide (TPR) repeat protein
MILCSLGLLYGVLRLAAYFPGVFLNPMTYLVAITTLFSVHAVIIAGRRKAHDETTLLLLLFVFFSAMALGPMFFAGAVLLFMFNRLTKIAGISAVISAFLGFTVIFQNYALASFLPVCQRMTEEYCRKVKAWNLFLDKKYRSALEEYEIAYSLNQDQETRKRVGQCHLHLGSVQKGIQHLEGILPQDYETLVSLADAYRTAGQLDRALAVCETAVALNIEPAEFLLRSAKLNARAGNEDRTRAALTAARKYGAPQYALFEILGDLYLAKKDPNAALAMYRQAIGYNNRSVTARSGIATVYYYRQDYEKAEKEFLMALKFDPSDDALYNNLGAIYIMTGEYQKARSVFERSVKINASQAEGYYNLGLVAEKTGDKSTAVAMYRKALSINAGFAPARQALDRLEEQSD